MISYYICDINSLYLIEYLAIEVLLNEVSYQCDDSVMVLAKEKPKALCITQEKARKAKEK